MSPTLLLQSFQICDTCRCQGSQFKSLDKSCRPVSGRAQVGMDGVRAELSLDAHGRDISCCSISKQRVCNCTTSAAVLREGRSCAGTRLGGRIYAARVLVLLPAANTEQARVTAATDINIP